MAEAEDVHQLAINPGRRKYVRARLEIRRSFETPRLFFLRSGPKDRISKGEEAELFGMRRMLKRALRL